MKTRRGKNPSYVPVILTFETLKEFRKFVTGVGESEIDDIMSFDDWRNLDLFLEEYED